MSRMSDASDASAPETRPLVAPYGDGDGDATGDSRQPASPAAIDVHRPTTTTDLWGFYSYSFAVEVFAVVSLTLFLPIALEEFARHNGRLLPGHTRPCPPSENRAPVARQGIPVPVCAVHLFGKWIDTASFSLFVYSASVACQALVVITMGDAADDDRMRRKLLLVFAGIGSTATFMFFFVSESSPTWPVAGLLAIFGNVGFGASIVCLNSFLPTLARGMPHVLAAYEEYLAAPRHLTDVTSAKYAALLSSTTSSISSKGIALGYFSGILALIAALIPVRLTEGKEWGLRIAIGGSGIWWALFTMPAALWLPRGGRGLILKSRRSFSAVSSWKSLGRMLSHYRRLANTFWFLLSWFLLSDAFTTITSTAVLFAKTTLGMPASSLVLVGIFTPASGILGALMWPKIQQRCDWLNSSRVGPVGNLRTLIVLVVAAWLVPVYGCLGFVLGKGGLSTSVEMYFFAMYFGSIYGAFQAYARSVFAGLIPPGQEAKWYALYSITDKYNRSLSFARNHSQLIPSTVRSSSFFGPLVVGVIADKTHNIRAGFIFIAFMMLLPIPILLKLVDVEQGREDAESYANEESTTST